MSNLAPNLLNLFRNPNWEIFQRGSSLTAITSTKYIADRYELELITSSGHQLRYDDLSAHADGTPLRTNSVSSTHGRIRNDVAVGVLAAGDLCWVDQKIEGFQARKAYNKNAYFRKWAYTNKAGIYTIVFKGAANTRYYLAEVSIPANEWFEIKVPVKKIDTSIGTWDKTNGAGIRAGICLFAGADHQSATLEQWASGNFFASPNQVNFSDAVDNRFYSTEWQFNAGSDLHPYDEVSRDFDTEQELCYRYYETSYNTNVAPGTITNVGAHKFVAPRSGGAEWTTVKIKRKRDTPSGVVYSAQTGAAGFISDRGTGNSGNTDVAAQFAYEGENTLALRDGGSFTADHFYDYHWTADAEL